MGSSLLSENFTDIRIGDSDFSIFGLSEIDLSENGEQNWVCEDVRKTLEVLKRRILIFIKLAFWNKFEVSFLSL